MMLKITEHPDEYLIFRVGTEHGATYAAFHSVEDARWYCNMKNGVCDAVYKAALDEARLSGLIDLYDDGSIGPSGIEPTLSPSFVRDYTPNLRVYLDNITSLEGPKE
jgi:hypothetical protein